MRHKYATRALVLGHTPVGETGATYALLTEELGLVFARAQGVRRPGAKLAGALVTLAESTVMLVRGKEGWRLVGAVGETNWFQALSDTDARARAGRVCGLVLRLVGGDASDTTLFATLRHFLASLATVPSEQRDAVEIMGALQVLAALGLDAGALPGPESPFAPAELAHVQRNRTHFVTRVNRGIAASGL